MPVSLRHRNFLKELDFSAEELRHLIDLAAALKAAKAAGYERPTLTGRNIALIFQTISTRTRSAFEVAAHDQGAHVTYLGPEESPIGAEESLRDTARVLGRMFDGIEFRGADQGDVEELGRHAGVPVWNGLTDRWHPTQMLADVLTMREHSNGRLADIAYCYLGDGGNNIARSLLVTGALLGMDVRVAAPRELWPDEDLRVVVDRLAKESEARVLLTSDVEQAADGAGFVYTDAWLATGESRDRERRIGLLRPYQVTRAVLAATGNRHVRFMHCLPASHNRETRTGRRVYDETGLDALEVTEDVFESPASIVFEQAENRLHTTKAVMVATLGDGP